MSVEHLAASNQLNLEELLKAKTLSADKIRQIQTALRGGEDEPAFFGNDMDFVVFGSLARGECTRSSDLDWTLLIDGQINVKHDKVAANIRKCLEDVNLAEPGSSGLFGEITYSNNLVQWIGGDRDTNHNLTRRLLLLLESGRVALEEDDGQPSGTSYARTVNAIIDTYIDHDSAFQSQHGKTDMVPRFLLNDIVRFWRTMCVDFAYKQRAQEGRKWALRNIKLRMSRKLLFLKGLMICAICFRKQNLATQDLKVKIQEAVFQQPLDFIVNEFQNFQIDQKLVIALLRSYNGFLQLLNNEDDRKYIANLDMNVVYEDGQFLEARNNANEFQTILTEIFFNRESLLKEFVKKYGLF